MDETITNSRRIFKGQVVKLDVHEVRMPDGQTARRELISHSGAVAVVALDTEQHVLLVRQFRIGAGAVLYEIPAGILEKEESPEVCAVRELQEEVGYKPGTLAILGSIYPSPGYSSEIIHLYLATDLEAAPLDGDTDEFIEVERVPLAAALKMIEAGEIRDSKTLIGLLRVARRLGI